MDGNVLRVVSRLTADPFDIKDVKTRSVVADKLRPMMPEGGTSVFTQALFELGALICLPETPKCEECPVSAYCLSHEQGREKEFPVRPPKKAKKEQELTVFVLSCGGKFALRKRSDKGLLAGLYELPNREGYLTEEEVLALYDGIIQPLPEATHVFTHIIWRMRGYLIEVPFEPAEEGLFFATAEEIEEKYSLPSAFSAYKKFCKR